MAGLSLAANHGLAMAEGRGGPVILLNSDALVPDGWAEATACAPVGFHRRLSHAFLTNTAEIFSVPLAGQVGCDDE